MRLINFFVIFATSALMTMPALSHTPLCACYDMGDGTVLCEGGFSDGSSAAGVEVSLIDSDGQTLIQSTMDENSEFEFEKPKSDFTVVFNAGPGHLIEISSNHIFQ